MATDESVRVKVTVKVHELKCDSWQYDLLAARRKTFEFRKNDRKFEVGDVLQLYRNLYSSFEQAIGAPSCSMETAYVAFKVIHILYGPNYGVPDGFCVMSLGELDCD